MLREEADQCFEGRLSRLLEFIQQKLEHRGALANAIWHLETDVVTLIQMIDEATGG